MSFNDNKSPMELTFTCPEKGGIFNCSEFRLVNNREIVTDEAGNRTVDAEVELEAPCPFCGKLHKYNINEIACPFPGIG